MFLIPVMDLKENSVVQAIKGERDKYRPIISLLTNSSEPLDVAKVLIEKTAAPALYIADLDAITKRDFHHDTIISQIAQTISADLWVDSGIQNFADVKRLLDLGVSHCIVSTESILELNTLTELFDKFPAQHFILSIDIKQNKLLTTMNEDAQQNLLAKLLRFPFQNIILLNLDHVGAKIGLNTASLQLVSNYSKANVFLGGGLCSLTELNNLDFAPVAGALSATALHNGQLNLDEVQKMNCYTNETYP